MNPRKVYVLLTGVTVLGYIYILSSLAVEEQRISFSLCLFRNLTGIPCPSCGTTRGIKELIHGNFSAALAMNGLCYVQALFLLVFPVMLLVDLVLHRRWVFLIYRWIIEFVNKRYVAIFLVGLIFLNWMYLISSGR